MAVSKEQLIAAVKWGEERAEQRAKELHEADIGDSRWPDETGFTEDDYWKDTDPTCAVIPADRSFLALVAMRAMRQQWAKMRARASYGETGKPPATSMPSAGQEK